jgi:hypothetical protein
MKITDVSLTAIISDLCLGTSSSIQSERVKQNNSYATGLAYRGHLKSAHNGIEDKNCRACKELRIKCNII